MVARLNLSRTTQEHLAYMAVRAADGFSGRWEIEMRDGGVRDFRESVKPNVSRNIDPSSAAVVESK